jgi:hypothetical protein
MKNGCKECEYLRAMGKAYRETSEARGKFLREALSVVALGHTFKDKDEWISNCRSVLDSPATDLGDGTNRVQMALLEAMVAAGYTVRGTLLVAPAKVCGLVNEIQRRWSKMVAEVR